MGADYVQIITADILHLMNLVYRRHSQSWKQAAS